MDCRIHAPGLGHQEMDSTAAFGAAVWLAMQAPKVKDVALHQLNGLVLQPQTAQSDVLISRSDGSGGWRPHLWLAYARLSAEAERDYARNPALILPQSAWQSGDRLWLVHIIAPLGFDSQMFKILRRLFAAQTARSLSPSSHWRGQQVLVWRGAQCTLQDATNYWRQRPIEA